jgi:hypothetical protein
VLDLFERAEGRPTDDMVGQLRLELRELGRRRADPYARPAAQDPSYRSIGSIWNHLSSIRGLHAGRLRYLPQELERLWPRYRADPNAIQAEAARIRLVLDVEEDEDRPAGVLALFLHDVHALIDDVVNTISALPGSKAPPEAVEAYVSAWQDLNTRPFLETLSAELQEVGAISLLNEAGLSGAQLSAKLVPFARWRTEWRSVRSLEALQRALRRANIVLGSLASVLPGVEAFKEFKDTTEAMLDEAVPPGGYLPAPAIA